MPFNPFKFIGTALWEVFGEDVVNNPRPEPPMPSPKQAYDYLISLRKRTPEEDVMLVQLARFLGRE